MYCIITCKHINEHQQVHNPDLAQNKSFYYPLDNKTALDARHFSP